MKWTTFGCGLLFGTAGIRILRSRDAKNAYAHATAAYLRAQEDVIKTVTDIKEDCQDIYAQAKEINEKRKVEVIEDLKVSE